MHRWILVPAFALGVVALVAAPANTAPKNAAEEMASYWTQTRMSQAIARDIVVDERGRSYMRDAAGVLRPYGDPGKPVSTAQPTRTVAPVSLDVWPGTGAVNTAAGRLYFEMPANKKATRWAAYVCSGTAVADSTANDVSLILTAAHCIYDDAHKVFARNVLFIPQQQATTGTGTDSTCLNDPLGCWFPDFGVVDNDWATRTWSANIAWDYGFYVVPNVDAHAGPGVIAALEAAVPAMTVGFNVTPETQADAAAIGYAYAQDPQLMTCHDALSTVGSVNWWLAACGLTGGASGGPWLQPVSAGDGPIISVNSWGYARKPGMAGPFLNGDSSARCLYDAAQTAPTVTGDGYVLVC